MDLGTSLPRDLPTDSARDALASCSQTAHRALTERTMLPVLTTQYLEEADELADRVGILDAGRIVAEGTPTELKRRVGKDLIVARLDGDATSAVGAVTALDGVESVEIHDGEMVIAAANGAACIGPVAIALNDCAVRVDELTLRTPTLDDVYVELTGSHIQTETESVDEPEPEAPTGELDARDNHRVMEAAR